MSRWKKRYLSIKGFYFDASHISFLVWDYHLLFFFQLWISSLKTLTLICSIFKQLKHNELGVVKPVMISLLQSVFNIQYKQSFICLPVFFVIIIFQNLLLQVIIVWVAGLSFSFSFMSHTHKERDINLATNADTFICWMWSETFRWRTQFSHTQLHVLFFSCLSKLHIILFMQHVSVPNIIQYIFSELNRAVVNATSPAFQLTWTSLGSCRVR